MGINWKNHIIEVLKEKYDELEYDGWSIMHIEYFTDMGFDEEFIKPLIMTVNMLIILRVFIILIF